MKKRRTHQSQSSIAQPKVGSARATTSFVQKQPGRSLLLKNEYPDQRWFQSVRTKALNWFAKNKRTLPWRTHPSPYRVWVSEIMLQQTQVQTVIDYFNRFVKRFPNIKSLADAEESQVLSLWEGLGYYRRAKNLHKAAKLICTDHGGEFPTEYDEVLKLPGIGRYTAGAILSIANNVRLPILEGNTYRLHARLLGLKENPRERKPESLLWQFATDLLPGPRSQSKAGDLNQALMEIGATLCKVSNPECQLCPIRSHCVAHEQGMETELPISSTPIQYESRRQALLVLEDDKGRAFVRQRKANEWWSGLWDFVRIDLPQQFVGKSKGKKTNPSVERWIAKHLETEFGVKFNQPPIIDFSFKHAVTKYRIQLDCYHIRRSDWNSDGSHQAVSLEEIEQLPLNVTARKLLNQLLDSKETASN